MCLLLGYFPCIYSFKESALIPDLKESWLISVHCFINHAIVSCLGLCFTLARAAFLLATASSASISTKFDKVRFSSLAHVSSSFFVSSEQINIILGRLYFQIGRAHV